MSVARTRLFRRNSTETATIYIFIYEAELLDFSHELVSLMKTSIQKRSHYEIVYKQRMNRKKFNLFD